MKARLFAILVCLCLILTGCGGNYVKGNENDVATDMEPVAGGDDVEDVFEEAFGESLEELGAYDGYFEGESADITVEHVSGTQDAYKLEGTTLTSTEIGEDSVYSVSGTFRGNIIIDVGDEFKLELELCGLSLVCDDTNPIVVVSGDEVSLKAKKNTKNYIYDMRSAIDSSDDTLYSGAVHSAVDLEICGKGEMTVVSESNKGIHTKDDLLVKNLTLLVVCTDNALKGNDSVEITSGNTTLIATEGDCIKTSNSDVSKKGNQRGSVSVTGGTHTLYAACDGIDAAYNAVIDGEETEINIYTDKYSAYTSTLASDTATDIGEAQTDNVPPMQDGSFPDGQPDGMPNGQPDGMPNGQPDDMPSGQPDGKPDVKPNEQGGEQGGFGGNFGGGHGGIGGNGGMQEGNTDKGDHSTKGIKAANEVIINGGTVNIKSYDDSIHANGGVELENGDSSVGNITVNGGAITVYSNDDGLHADGAVLINDGAVSVTGSYEGIEGDTVAILGGNISVYASDDGINATATSGEAIRISGGRIFVYCSGDGIDSNSLTSYGGIIFSGGSTVIISDATSDSAIDTEQGYAYEGGEVLAVMPRGGMTSEATHCKSFSSVGSMVQMSLSTGEYLVAEIGDRTATVRMPLSMSACVVVLGDSSPSIKSATSTSQSLDENGVGWN